MRSLGVIVFVAITAAAGLYFAQRKTVARGDVLAAQLVEANPLLEALDCDREVPIGVDGASFACRARFKNGDVASYQFVLDREGSILVQAQGPTERAPVIKKTSDPWGD